jgi:hypothetical protein
MSRLNDYDANTPTPTPTPTPGKPGKRHLTLVVTAAVLIDMAQAPSRRHLI